MLVLFHDYTSPASAVAVARVTRLVAEGMPAGIEGTEVLGVDATLPVTLELLAELDAVAPQAREEGVTLRRPAGLPPTAAAHLVEDLARASGHADAWRARCYRAFWADGADIGDTAVLVRLAAEVGLDPAAVERHLDDRLALLEIRQRFARHRREGVGGVPTISYDRTLVPGLLDDADLRALAALDPSSG